MLVHFLAAYYSHWAHTKIAPRAPHHHEAFNFCRAVKTGRLSEPLHFPWKNGTEIIDVDDKSRPRIIFGMFIKQKIFDCGIRNPVLIPVPSKDGLFNSADFRSYQMVREALCGDRNYPVIPALRFTESLMPANAGGPRQTSALYPFLTLANEVPKGGIVLIDDILTTGSSIKAACKRLAEAKINVAAAIVCGYTVHKSSFPAFGDHQLQITLSEEGEDIGQHSDPMWHWQ